MSDPGLSPTAKALLAAAKADGPSAAARAKIWSGVAATGAGVGAVGASAIGVGSASAGTASSASISAGAVGAGGKLVAIGALFGSAMTVGLAATLLGIGTTPTLRPEPPYALYADQGGSAEIAPLSARTDREGVEARAFVSPALAGAARAAAGAGDRASGGAANDGAGKEGVANDGAAREGARRARSESPRVVTEDTLMRESALVAEARGALVRGDAEKALAVLKTTKALRHRELEPEELALEAKALRALGKEDAAIEREMTLKTKYPEHALAR